MLGAEKAGLKLGTQLVEVLGVVAQVEVVVARHGTATAHPRLVHTQLLLLREPLYH